MIASKGSACQCHRMLTVCSYWCCTEAPVTLPKELGWIWCKEHKEHGEKEHGTK